MSTCCNFNPVVSVVTHTCSCGDEHTGINRIVAGFDISGNTDIHVFSGIAEDSRRNAGRDVDIARDVKTLIVAVGKVLVYQDSSRYCRRAVAVDRDVAIECGGVDRVCTQSANIF